MGRRKYHSKKIIPKSSNNSGNKKKFKEIKKEITFKDDSEGSGDEVYEDNYSLEDFVKMDFTDETDLFRHFFRCLKKTRHLLKLTEQLSRSNAKTIDELFAIQENPPLNDPAFKPETPAGGANPKLINASKKIRLETSKQNGERRLIAAENLKFGELLIMERAVIMTDLLNSYIQQFPIYRCHHCLRFIGLFLTCPTCDIVTFCSYKCRYISWNEYHRWECFGLQRRFWHTAKPQYIALRLMFNGAQNGFNFGTKEFQDDFKVDEEHYGDKKNPYKYLYKLKVNTRNRPRKELSEILLKCSELLVYLIEDTDFFPSLCKFPEYSTKRLYDVYMIVGGFLVRHYIQAELYTIYVDPTNGHDSLYTEKYNFQSGAIFMTASLLNHHCKPNAICSFRENYIIVKAFQEIQAGEEITLEKYKPNSTEVACHCKHCIAKMIKKYEHNSFICSKCKGKVIPSGVLKDAGSYSFSSFELKQLETQLGILKCKGCNAVHELRVFKYILKSGQKYLSAYEKNNKLEHLVAALELYKLVLQPTHLFLVNFYENIVKLRLNRGPNYFSLTIPDIKNHLSILELQYGEYSYMTLKTMTKYSFRLLDYCQTFKTYPEDIIIFCDEMFKQIQKVAKFYYLEHKLDNYLEILRNIKSVIEETQLEKKG